MLRTWKLTYEIGWCAEHEEDIYVVAHTETKARKKAGEIARKRFAKQIGNNMLVLVKCQTVEDNNA